MTVIPSKIIIRIPGAKRRLAPSNQHVFLTGVFSLTPDCVNALPEYCDATYKWSCSGIQFCRGWEPTDSSVFIPDSEINNLVSIFRFLEVALQMLLTLKS